MTSVWSQLKGLLVRLEPWLVLVAYGPSCLGLLAIGPRLPGLAARESIVGVVGLYAAASTLVVGAIVVAGIVPGLALCRMLRTPQVGCPVEPCARPRVSAVPTELREPP